MKRSSVIRLDNKTILFGGEKYTIRETYSSTQSRPVPRGGPSPLYLENKKLREQVDNMEQDILNYKKTIEKLKLQKLYLEFKLDHYVKLIPKHLDPRPAWVE